VRILVTNIVRYFKHRVNWTEQLEDETQVPHTQWNITFVYSEAGQRFEDTVRFEGEVDGVTAEARADAMLLEVDEFYVGYKSKKSDGKDKPE